jgi:hypothetical protein
MEGVMNISALHAHVRGLVQGTSPAANSQDGGAETVQLTVAERLSLHTLQRSLQLVGGDLARLEPAGESPYWIARVPQQKAH